MYLLDTNRHWSVWLVIANHFIDLFRVCDDLMIINIISLVTV